MSEEHRIQWNSGDLLSIAEAAEYLDVARQRIHQFIQQDRIQGARKVGKTWVIPFESLDNIELRHAGRPKKTS